MGIFTALSHGLQLFAGVLICFICKHCEGSDYFHCILNADHLFGAQLKFVKGMKRQCVYKVALGFVHHVVLL